LACAVRHMGAMTAPDLIVTNFNPNFTGVSATAANIVRLQATRYDLRLVGHPLPGAPDPISLKEARALCKGATRQVIWHVRRNTEMRAAIWTRDVLRLPARIVFTSAAIRRHSAVPRWLIRQMDAIIATTSEAATFVPNVRAVVPHGVDTDAFHPAPDRASAWATLGHGGARGIACVGRIRPEKGTDLFVEAICATLSECPDTTALIIGRAMPRHEGFAATLRARIAAAGLSKRVIFTGELPPQTLAKTMRALSLLMALPRYEGYGMTPLEAMASGVPFVGSDTGYFSSFATDGQAGIIVPAGAHTAAAQAATMLLRDTERLSNMGQNARRIAKQRYSADTEADGIDAVYQQLWAQE
jgi:mannosyltransferase